MPFRFLFAALTLLVMGVPRAEALTQWLNVQPWALCSGQAASTCSAPGFDALYLQDIYAQADIEISVLDTLYLTDFPFPRAESGDVAPVQTLKDFGGFLLNFEVPENTVSVGFTPEMDGTTIGIAAVDAPGFPFALVQSGLGGAYEAAVTAHEIGHVLGGRHENAPHARQLLHPTIRESRFDDPDYLPEISAANAAAMTDSSLLGAPTLSASPVSFAIPTPLPGALPALGAGLGALLLLRRRRPPTGDGAGGGAAAA